MAIVVGIGEVTVYIILAVVSIFIALQTRYRKKHFPPKTNVFTNPPGPFDMFFSKVIFILTVPSIVLMFTIIPQNPDDLFAGIAIYGGIFIFFMILGFRAVLHPPGDYYIDKDGVHFLREYKKSITFSEITEAAWYDYAHVDGAETTAKLIAHGKKIVLYNLPKGLYKHYISGENVFVPKREAVRSLPKRIFTGIMYIMFFAAILTFWIFTGYDGSPVKNTSEYTYEQLYQEADIPHYLVDHGDLTQVSLQVWKTALHLERAIMILYPLMFLCVFVNMFWEMRIHKARYK